MRAETLFCVRLLDKTAAQQCYTNLALDAALRDSNLQPPEKRRAAALYYGVMERQLTLSHILRGYSKKPPEKLDASVRHLLYCGLYQLLYMQIPPNAVVNDCVSLTKPLRYGSASGFVNAVLRSFLRDDRQIRYPKAPDAAAGIRYSAPLWLVKKLRAEYGDAVMESLLSDALGRAPIMLRRNPLAGDVDVFCRDLDGLEAEPVPALPDCWQLLGGDVTGTTAFRRGALHVQDLASQLCCHALGVQPGETVLDVCAAPGGKSFTLAELMQGTGTVYAFDLHAKRVKLIADGAARLGLSNVRAAVGDASVYQPELPMADRILCDVPCSGLGVIRRKPEIKYKDPDAFAGLPAVQTQILETASRYLKPGGTLLYSTCTLSRAENDAVVDRFLETHPAFVAAADLDTLGVGLQGWKTTLYPALLGSDGFFFAKLKRLE